MMELTTEDKQRIEQQLDALFEHFYHDKELTVRQIMFKIAEYATIYEREQQDKLEDIQKENRRLKKLNEYLEAILTKKQSRTYEHYKVLTEGLDE